MFFHLLKIILTSLLFIGTIHYVCILLKNNLKSKSKEVEREHVIIEPPVNEEPRVNEENMNDALNDYIKELKIDS